MIREAGITLQYKIKVIRVAGIKLPHEITVIRLASITAWDKGDKGGRHNSMGLK